MAENIVDRAIAKLKADAEAKAAVAEPAQTAPILPLETSGVPVGIAATPAPMPDVAQQVAQVPVQTPVAAPVAQPIPVGIAAPELLPVPAEPGMPSTQMREAVGPQELPLLLEDQASAGPQAIVQMPVAQPAPVAPEAVQAASQPTVEDVEKQIEKESAPMRLDEAQKRAKEAVKSEAVQAASQEAADKQKAKDQVDEIDKEVRLKSLPEIFAKGTTGEKFTAVLALALGGISQGLLRSAENPVITFINQQVEAQARRDKLNQEEKESLRRQALQTAEVKVKEMEAKTQDNYRKQQLSLMRDELNLKAQGMFQDQLAAKDSMGLRAKVRSGKALSPDDILQLTDKQMESIVELPDGKRVAATSVRSKAEFDKYSQEVYGAQSALQKLLEISKKPLPNPIFQPQQRKKVMDEVELLRKAVIGGIRLPYFGPGAFQKFEQDSAARIVGDPAAIFSLQGNQRNLLEKLKLDLDTKLSAAAKRSGIRENVVPETFRIVQGVAKPESQILREFMADRVAKKLPPITVDRALDAIKQQFPELEPNQ